MNACMKSWQGVIEPQNKRFLMDDSSPAVLCSSTFTSCTPGLSEPVPGVWGGGLTFLPQIFTGTLTPSIKEQIMPTTILTPPDFWTFLWLCTRAHIVVM